MSTFRKVLRAGAFAALLLTAASGPATIACAQGTIPKDAESINSNFETLKDLVDKAEQSLKDAIAKGDAKKANDMRRNLQFYARRLAALEKAATGKAVMAKDSQIVQKITELKDKTNDIISKNKPAPPPAAAHITAASKHKKGAQRTRTSTAVREKGFTPPDRLINQGSGH
jgi:hypothetical protein